MGFASFHAHKSSTSHKQKNRLVLPRTTADANCTSGGLYVAPTAGASVPSSEPLVISWDTTCLSSTKVDIHLLAPWYAGSNTEMTSWTSVTNSDGQKSVTINPAWWNSTASVQVELAIVAAGVPIGMSTLPAGPIWTLTYDGTSSSSSSGSSTASDTSSDTLVGTTKSLSPGKTAAAVLLPLIAVFALLGFLYTRYARKKAAAKSQRFSQAIDKRMSTISADWKSMSAAGAQAAIRSSMAISTTGARDSGAFSFGAIRPLSSIDADGGAPVPQMKQVRTGTGVGLRHPTPAGGVAFAAERQSRVSRVSFADTVVSRPSGESRRTRAFHSAYIPPVPARPGSEYPNEKSGYDEKSEADAQLSPRQTTGPLTLTPEDIRARIDSPSTPTSQEYDEVMPALSLMRTSSTQGHGDSLHDEYLLPLPPAPTHSASTPQAYLPPLSPSPAYSPSSVPAPAYSPSGATYAPTSPSFSTPPASAAFSPSALAFSPSAGAGTPPVMSPDDLLRTYAMRKPPPSAFAPAEKEPKAKGRKLSIRASLGLKKSEKERERERPATPSIGYPMPLPPSPSPTPYSPQEGGMAGVGARAGAGAGFAGVGVEQHVQYVVGEDEEGDGDFEDAYGGVN